MATLNSPGVQVNVIDESFYTPSAPGTVPLLFVASRQDKKNPSGTTALGTTAANAGKVWLITSQRNLADTFGTPLFPTDAGGNPQHGSEQNEYGLQAAYSSLGVSSRAYIVRADLDLAALTPTSTIPLGAPVAGTYWVDTASSVFGVKEWNSSTQAFTVKTPIVLNDDSPALYFNGTIPTPVVGRIGDYCMRVTTSNANRLFYKRADNTWSIVYNGFDNGKSLQISPHYTYPNFNGSTATGSIWVTTTTPSNGANWSIKLYNGSSRAWTTVTAPIYDSIASANAAFDASGGGKNIAAGTLFIESDFNNNTEASFKIWRKSASGTTSINGRAISYQLTANTTATFTIRETNLAGAWGATKTVTLFTSVVGTELGSLVPAALSAQGLTYVTATWDNVANILTITHTAGGAFELKDGISTPLATLFTLANTANLSTAPALDMFDYIATTWKPLVYEARSTAPYTTPADGKLWYDTNLVADIMYNTGAAWVGYRNAFPSTDPNGPIIGATQPAAETGNSQGGPLVTGDIWIDTSDMDMYGQNIYVYNGTKWVKQDPTDQTTPTGWVFADARWSGAGDDVVPDSTVKLLTYDYVDPDCPDPRLYPKGTRLWNTRRSGFTVKKYVQGYINLNATNPRQSDAAMSGYFADRWVSQHPTAVDGSPMFARMAQRQQVVQAFKSLIDNNASVRDSDTLGFNLMATPGYPEAIQNMIALNVDRGLTAFVLGDTPFRLAPTGTALSAWGMNTANAADNGDNGGTSHDEYMAMYYPSGYTNDLTGNHIVVPPSHMMLRTIINSDAKSYPWFAPAGTRRGGVDNASSVGYITMEGEFKTVALHQGLRDVLQDPKVAINPIATLTGVGVLAYGQRTRAKNASALDRINVSRLVIYLRKQLDILARPFLFEPNDAQTRREIKAATESLLLELVGQRALYDYAVVCDTTNNTPSRIDRNELYLDIAIEPVKAVEYIYIPLRIKNTGDIAKGL
jgi:hypothetical protein